MPILDGRVAVVTGAGRGIGRAIALILARNGASVALTGRNCERLDAVAAEIGAVGGRALVQAGDVSDHQRVRATFEAIRAQLGPVDILVNNAGITASNKFVNTDDETWERIMRVNATGPFYCCREVIPAMIERRWGRIINIASVAALNGLPYSAAYSASKHALLGLTRSIALEHASYGITANAICPGWTETDMLADSLGTIVARTGRTPDEARASILAMSGQSRFVSADEVATVALELAGPDSQANGQAVLLAP
ncbi:MAG TPA: SDR family NAD(P)-dependent oxidoreductase [Roseiflexaceae bacterium]|nr:SDR family NAD(P)-dependent oxidoreductase [Roseiflexaceae bacterium]